MKAPEGFSNPDQLVCKLNKSLYGLKQASRQCFARLNEELLHKGYYQSKNDYSLFIKKIASNLTVVAVYVDDIILTGSDLDEILLLKQHLHDVFSIKDLGILNYFLGMEVSHSSAGIIMTQFKFRKELLATCGLDVSKRAKTPLSASTKLSASEGDLYPDPELYKCLVGKLNFLTHTRPIHASTSNSTL